MDESITQFAPVERLEKEEILLQTIKILGLRNAIRILDVLPSMAAILNKSRQVIYANDSFIKTIGKKQFEDALGYRPGELLDCVHAHDHSNGCGAGNDCRYCGAVLTVLLSQETGNEEENDCRITIDKNGKHISLDLHVKAKPLEVDNDVYYIIVIDDISNQKRREYLEQTFIHDIANSAWTLSSRLEFFPRDGLSEIQDQYFHGLKDETSKLLDEIQSHRDLIRLENNQLKPQFENVNSLELIQSVIHTISTDNIAKDKRIVLSKDNTSINFKTDIRLLRRVLLNLLKNALEASKTHEEIVFGCNQKDSMIIFSIKNDKVLSDAVKSQIFQRSFSTKGTGRGLGTYSARILVEDYLGGHVYFKSSEEIGTIFYVELKNTN
ncbi:MAG: PAS domain-containing sensor histidine kinase [Candidatus Heimdallarchaeota archaeon]|nr:PAS domain-containing sensor histidine kinase [Candidatus Heimdallarchaeota archaeon]